ncbi:hypothetical protein B0H34DRAFT_729909 [Crassisporium funariophilum]|nr:hypothetical protein B0H34DRAFT_729909 [Crassisporium funariophilum]
MSSVEINPLPPSYLDPFTDSTGAWAPGSELPAYTPSYVPAPAQRPNRPSQGPKEFEYDVKRKGKAFAVMSVTADATLSKKMPTYFEGVPIKGQVKLTLDKPDAIQAVIVSAQGQVVTGAGPGEQLTFVDVSRTLWSQTMGEPRSASIGEESNPESPITSPSDRFTSKLQGDFLWDFCLELPKEVVKQIGQQQVPQVYRLPQTFAERHTRATVTYQLCVRIVRNKFRTDHKILAQFGYIPIIRPDPFSQLRQLAYQEGSPLLGPNIDPVGWQSLEQVRVRGKIFNDRSINIGCTLFLAKPLCYTRGTVIPFFMELESDDIQALDLLSSPKTIVVRLRRCIKYHVNAESTLESLAWKDSIDHSQLAVWWPSTERASLDSKSKRFLNGEMHLKPDMKPTSAMAHFRIQYSVIMFPFDTPGYEAASSDILLEQPVEIGTAHSQGPRPRMYAPPGYDSDIGPTTAPYAFHATSAGF